MPDLNWDANHLYRVGATTQHLDDPPGEEAISDDHRKAIEPWLSAVFQSEHLSLLVGSGFTNAVVNAAGGKVAGMGPPEFGCEYEDKVKEFAKQTAEACDRGEPNIEDHLRVAFQLVGGLEVIGETAKATAWKRAITKALQEFLASVLRAESSVAQADPVKRERANDLLVSFLMSFASRTATRERLHTFTTNYDRFIEYGCDQAGLRIIDRFVGGLTPVFRSSRVGVDYHYNPPGIRGEPRYLEGVLRLTKLHGSLDWKWEGRDLRRYAVAFGASEDHPDVVRDPLETTMIYPNAVKDMETLNYPYADLFRDFSASTCRANASLVTYGYGFGDDHINRVIKDMLTIPSTHLVIMSWDHAGGRIQKFVEDVGRHAQISLLIGSHFGDLGTLVDHYLPKPAIDPITIRQAALKEHRGDYSPSSTAGAVADTSTPPSSAMPGNADPAAHPPPPPPTTQSSTPPAPPSPTRSAPPAPPRLPRDNPPPPAPSEEEGR